MSCKTPNELHYQVTPACEPANKVLENYFRLEVNLASLYHDWSQRDDVFASRYSSVYGVRLLKQDPFEALVAFICSSNNNIKRIQLMMNRLCATFGTSLGYHGDQHFYSFPSLVSLNDCEAHLREMGFGYRSKFISETTRLISEQLGGVEWLHSLKHTSYKGIIIYKK